MSEIFSSLFRSLTRTVSAAFSLARRADIDCGCEVSRLALKMMIHCCVRHCSVGLSPEVGRSYFWKTLTFGKGTTHGQNLAEICGQRNCVVWLAYSLHFNAAFSDEILHAHFLSLPDPAPANTRFQSAFWFPLPWCLSFGGGQPRSM